MRKIAATYIYVQNSVFLKNSYLLLDNGIIIDIVDTKGNLEEQAGMEHYSGMLVPSNFKDVFSELKAKQELNPDKLFTVLSEIDGFKVGEKTGVCLISGMDLSKQILLPSSKLKQLA